MNVNMAMTERRRTMGFSLRLILSLYGDEWFILDADLIVATVVAEGMSEFAYVVPGSTP